MAISLDIDDDIPVPDRNDPEGMQNLLAAAQAASRAARLLEDHGLQLQTNDGDRAIAAALATEYGKDPIATSAAATPARLSQIRPAALDLTAHILSEFGHRVVEDAAQVRHMVTNKLIQETENPDPKIRVKALELLGKFTDVGLFTERSEVVVKHQTTDDLRAKLRDKLSALKDVTPADGIEDADVYGDDPIDGDD